MRKLALLLVSASVAACGSSGSSSSGGGTTPLAGTVGGHAFAPADVKAIVTGSGSSPCSLPLGGPTIPIGLKALALEVTSYANACGDFGGGACPSGAGAQNVTLLVAKLNSAGAATEPALGAGTYIVSASPSVITPDGPPGLYTVAYGQAAAFDPSGCPTTHGTVAGGTLRLDQVSGPVTGHVAVTFQDGSSLAGDFSAPICAASPDVCTLALDALAVEGVPKFCTLPAACGP